MSKSLRGFVMRFNDCELTVYETQAMFGLSKSAFDKWFNDGEMAGVLHPASEDQKNSDVTGARRYSESDVQRALIELEEKGYKPIELDVWTTSDVMKHGVIPFLSQCVRDGEVKIAMLNQQKKEISRFKFVTESNIPSTKIKVRDFLPHKRSLAKAVGMTLVTRSFPKIGFKVTEVGNGGLDEKIQKTKGY